MQKKPKFRIIGHGRYITLSLSHYRSDFKVLWWGFGGFREELDQELITITKEIGNGTHTHVNYTPTLNKSHVRDFQNTSHAQDFKRNNSHNQSSITYKKFNTQLYITNNLCISSSISGSGSCEPWAQMRETNEILENNLKLQEHAEHIEYKENFAR